METAYFNWHRVIQAKYSRLDSWARILVQVTINRRLLIGRDGHQLETANHRRAIRTVIQIQDPNGNPDHPQNVMDCSLPQDTLLYHFVTNPADGRTD